MYSKDDIFASSKGRWDFTIAVIVIILFSVFIYSYIFPSDDELNEMTTETTAQENDVAIEKVEESRFPDAKIYRPTEIIAVNPYEEDIGKVTVITDFWWSRSEKITADDQETIPIKKKVSSKEKGSDENARPTKDAMPIATDYSSTKAQEAEIEVEEVEKKALGKQTNEMNTQKVVPPKTTLNTESFDCTIVIGVFEDQKNKKAIIDKLKAQGYAIDEGNLRENMHYVGVPVACDQINEKERLLKELNQAFGINSWVKKK